LQAAHRDVKHANRDSDKGQERTAMHNSPLMFVVPHGDGGMISLMMKVRESHLHGPSDLASSEADNFLSALPALTLDVHESHGVDESGHKAVTVKFFAVGRELRFMTGPTPLSVATSIASRLRQPRPGFRIIDLRDTFKVVAVVIESVTGRRPADGQVLLRETGVNSMRKLVEFEHALTTVLGISITPDEIRLGHSVKQVASLVERRVKRTGRQHAGEGS